MTKPDNTAITAAKLHALREAVRAAGAFEKAPFATVMKFACHTIAGVAIYWVCLSAPAAEALVLIPPAALVLIVGVMVGHDATHGAAFASPHANRVLRGLAFPLLSGMSGLFWRYKHNWLHHRNPNVVGRDEDLEILPFAVGEACHRSCNRLFQWIQRNLQVGWVIWLLTALLPWDLRKRSARYLVSHARRSGIDGDWIFDVAMIGCHWMLFVIVPAWIFGLGRALFVYLGVWAIGGLYLGVVGLAGHTARPLIEDFDDPLAVQFHTARNLCLGPVLSWWFVGLDRQIEHHIFPQVSHLRLKRCVSAVREFAHNHDLPYREQTLADCLHEITVYFGTAWRDPAFRVVRGRLLAVSDEVH